MIEEPFKPKNAPHRPWPRNLWSANLPLVKNRRLTLLGQQIRHLREAKGNSQEQFAALAGLDRAYYGGIERGERNVAALNLIKIALALEVEVGALFPTSTALRHR